MGGGSTSDLDVIPAVPTEIWLREALPAVTQPVCLTGDTGACRVADYYVERSGYTLDWARFNYVFSLLMGFTAAFCSAWWVTRFTRPSPSSDKASRLGP